jgi:TolB-like protein/tetratricopeptide (TPR) repeat protein
MTTNGIPSQSAIREQVDRLRVNGSLAASDRLMALLDHLVEETLAERGHKLRETAIGNAVYNRDPPYDPRIDSTVRVEMRRLRKKLQEYFAADGFYDPVIISIPSGTYAPVFEINSSERKSSMRSLASPGDIFRAGPGTRVAVLPVRVIAGDDDAKDFADSLTDELIFALGSEPGLKVPSRATTFAYAEKIPSIPTLAAELGLDAVIQGTVRQNSDTIRATIEISDPRGFVVSSDRFESSLTSGGDLPERLATTLASRLRFDSSKMRARQISPGPVAIESHGKVYRARQMLDRQTPEGLREALQLFIEVAATAPDYARGHSGISDCYCDMFRIGLIASEDALAEARPAAEHALAIDADSPEAFTALGTIKAWLERDRAGAEADFEHALVIGQNARTARIYGSYLALLGSYDDAERLFLEARRIEPFSQQQDIAEALSRFQARQFDWLADDRMAIEIRNAPMEAIYYMALCNQFGCASKTEDVIAPLSRARTSHPQLLFCAAELEAWNGAPAKARKLLETGNAKASGFAHAVLACSVGAEAAVFRHLSDALDRRELATVWMRSDPRFDFVRNTDEFAGLLDRLDALRLS